MKKQPVLITDAARSQADQFRSRQIRYVTMMGLRAVCLILGAVVISVRSALLSLWRSEAAIVVAAIAATLTLLALVSPLGAFRRLTELLERFAHGVGVVLTWVLMGLVYYLLFLPVGLFLRATGRLRLEKRPDPSRATYWRPAQRRPDGLERYRRQF